MKYFYDKNTLELFKAEQMTAQKAGRVGHTQGYLLTPANTGSKTKPYWEPLTAFSNTESSVISTESKYIEVAEVTLGDYSKPIEPEEPEVPED